MLIVTSDYANLVARAPGLANWPGPRFAALHPGHGIPEEGLRTLQETFVLYDLADRVTCNLNLLRTMILHAAARGWQPAGPLLFVSGDVGGAEMTALAKEVVASPLMMRFEGAEDAAALADGAPDLSLLLLGKDAAESPLIMMFFGNMEPDLGPEHTRASLNMLKEHLV